MWVHISRILLRHRIPVLVGIGLVTVLMGYFSQFAKIQFELPKLLPGDDSTSVAYEEFKEVFGNEATVFILAIEEDLFSDVDLFNAWYKLGNDINQLNGIDTIISATHAFNLKKNTELKRFDVVPTVKGPAKNKQELDSIEQSIAQLPFYKGLLYNDSTGVSLMLISMKRAVFDSKDRAASVDKMDLVIDAFEQNQNIKLRHSGLPFIRTVITKMVFKEMKMNIALAILITILLLFVFFRNWRPVVVSMLVVVIGVIWSLGLMGMLGYEISILTGLIPPLVIVIGVPNCIFLINKYHHEVKFHGNQTKALTRVVQKVGKATFMTNATTAAGFFTFVFIQSAVLREFGIVASISIMMLFTISLTIISVLFSFMPPPKEHHTKHLDASFIKKFVESLVVMVTEHRKLVYVAATALVAFALYGVTKIQTTGNLVDDLAEDHFVNQDLRFFEKNFNGVMPFEIFIDTKKPGVAAQDKVIRRLDKLEKLLEQYPEFSRPVSMVDGMKFTKQAFYNGNPKKFSLITREEKAFFKPYVENAKESQRFLSAFLDSTKQFTRVTVNVADVGTKQMDTLLAELRPKVDSIFSPEKYNVRFTGTSVTFLAGTNYLVKNLFISLGIAIVIISLIMALLFSSFRIILVSLITNFIPLILAAGLMGYFDIPIKPSTILVFSIAFGIAVDDTIHFLAKYRQELKIHDWNIGPAAIAALRETGVSMTYTSIILFCGFTVFAFSEFGGTQAMGVLISFTLLIAMLANLCVLPSLLMSLNKSVTTKSFNEPMLEILDEEEDIEVDELKVKEGQIGQGSTVFGGEPLDPNKITKK